MRDPLTELQSIAASAERGIGFSDRMTEVVVALRRIVPLWSFGAVVVPDPRSRSTTPALSFSTLPSTAHLDEYFRAYAQENPLTPHLRRTTGVPRVLTDDLPRSRFRENGYAGEFLPRLGIGNSLSAAHRMPDGRSLIYGVNLGRRPGDFTERQRKLLAAASTAIARAAFEPVFLDWLVGLSEDTAGGIRVSARGEIVRVDLSAHATLRRARCADPYREIAARARQLIARRVRPGWTEEMALPAGPGDAVRIRLVKLDERSGIGAIALVDVAPMRRRVADGVLTPREREVAELAVRGSTNAVIARTLGVGPDAVKWHLKRVFKKVGVSSRTELAAFFLGGL